MIRIIQNLEIAQLLQSIDGDNNPSNDIHIRDEIKEKFKIKEKISQNLIARPKDKNDTAQNFV